VLSREHRCPTSIVIFVIDDAAAVARVENVEPRGQPNRSEWASDQHISRAESIFDPALGWHRKAHPGAALQRLSLALGTGTMIGDETDLIELRPPAPLSVGINILGICAVVVTEKLQPQPDRRL